MTDKKPILNGLSVGQVAQRSGVAVSAIHFYESLGLIKSWRTAGNQRRYGREVLRYVAIIKVAQRAGIALETLRKMFQKLTADDKISRKEWEAMSQLWREELDQRILRLTRLRDELQSCIGCGCLSLQDCPLRNPGDVLGQEGSGPRILERQRDER